MSKRLLTHHLRLLVAGVLAIVIGSNKMDTASAENAPDAEKIIRDSGVTGGLVVHLSCGDGGLTAALRIGDAFLVHGLDTNPADVANAREYLQALGAYGPVSVDTFDGRHLPYVDNLVNLVVAEDLGEVPMVEVMRVLAPGGVAFFPNRKSKVGNRKWVKPWPEGIDQWSHFLYDASGNPVATDRRVGPPRHTQWEDGPRASRSHENMSSVSAVVSAGGRVFSIMDEGPLVSIYLPSQWSLTARDAFNGVTLWSKPIAVWHSRLFPLKSGPFQLPRRMVAADDRLYVTLGLYEPLSEIDTATGEVVRTFQKTEHTEEVLLCDGKLIVVVNDNKETIPYEVAKLKRREGHTIAVEAERSIVAIDANSGRPIWIKQAGSVTPMTTTADASRVLFHNDRGIQCLDMASGEVLWQTPLEQKFALKTNFSPALLVEDDVLCLSSDKRLAAFSVKSGERLWNVECAASTYRSPISVCAINGVVWVPESISWNRNTRNRTQGSLVGYDLRTGEKVQEVPVDVEQGVGVCHHRCCMPKATDKFLITSWPGIEFTDTTTGEMRASHWIRGACLYGTMPANGLIYAPPNPCACYPEGKLNGFQVLAPARESRVQSRESRDEVRLQRGPAYGQIENRKSQRLADIPTRR